MAMSELGRQLSCVVLYLAKLVFFGSLFVCLFLPFFFLFLSQMLYIYIWRRKYKKLICAAALNIMTTALKENGPSVFTSILYTSNYSVNSLSIVTPVKTLYLKI